MRKIYKSIVPMLLVISMIFALGVESIGTDNPIVENDNEQIEGVIPGPEESELDGPVAEEPVVNSETLEEPGETTKVPEDTPGDTDEDITQNGEEGTNQDGEQAIGPQEPDGSEEPAEPGEENQTKPGDQEDPEEAEDQTKAEGSDEEKDEDLIKPSAKLTINHLEKASNEILDTQIMENLEIGSLINSLDFIKEFEGLMFLESSSLELTLVEGDNELNLYYGIVDNIDDEENENYEVGEAPDFLPGEEVQEPLPNIQTFSPGELGPFPEIQKYSPMGMLNLMNTATDPQVKNAPVISYGDETGNKTWPQPGSLKLNKTGQRVAGTGNKFEVKLEIEGKNRIETSDIVLVIDRSGSMGSGGRMTNAKTAAISFVNTMLSDPNTTTRIALVSFAGEVTINKNFTGYSGKASLISAINGLSASGGTHIQAGIRQGIAVLNGSSANNKSIVFLGDGGATYSYKPTNPDSYLEYWKTSSGINYRRTTSDIPQAGFDYSTRVGSGSNEYYEYDSSWWNSYSYNYRHGAHAVAEAGFAPAGQNIYTIALGAGTEGEWTLNNMQNSGYYSTPDPTSLTAIYDEIAGSISSAATNAVVTDPLGDMYDILGINATNYNSLITVSHGTLSWDDITETITWNIGTISEGTNYWMKYKVALDYSAEGGVYYPANKPTYISYKNIDGAQGKKYFPIPEFRLREIEIKKILNDGKAGDENKEFNIILEGPNNKTWTVSLKPGESKKIKGLLPGSYTMKEIVPMNFELVSGTGQITIGTNSWKTSVEVTNKRSNGGWFWDDDQRINSFTGIVTDPPAGSEQDEPEPNSFISKLKTTILPEEQEQPGEPLEIED